MAESPWRPLDPTGTPPAFFEAMALRNLGALDQAIDRMEFARKQIPHRYHILNNLGLMYLENKDIKKAEEVFSTAIKFHPTQYQTFEHLSLCFMQLGKNDEALKLLERIPESAIRSSARSNLEHLRNHKTRGF